MKNGNKIPVWFILSILIFLACASSSPQQQNVIAVNPEVTYQTFDHWEATAQSGEIEYPQLFAKVRDALFDRAVNDLGINRLRLEIYNGSENPVDYFTPFFEGRISRQEWKTHWFEIINDNADPLVIDPAGFHFAQMDRTIDEVVIPVKQRLEAKGEKLYVNLNYVDFGKSAFEHRNFPEEYAEFMLATFLHIQEKYGWTPDGIEMVLEADNAGWNGTQLGQALVAAGRRLRANGFTPDFIAPSTVSMANAIPFLDQMVQAPGFGQYFTELSYHRYGGVSDSNLQNIGSRAIAAGLKTSHLERIGAGHEDLHKDLTLGRNSSWAQYTMAWPMSDGSDDGGKYFLIDDRDPNQPTVQMGSRTKFLRQYFKYIRPKAVRIEATTSNPTFDPVAFINADCKPAVVVKAGGSGTLTIQGLPAGVYGVKYTTDAEYDIDRPEVALTAGQSLQTTMPAAGVITIYARSVSCAPLANVSAASYRGGALAAESIVAAFGKDLANASLLAPQAPLPPVLGETSVKVRDSRGVERLAPLFFVSPKQINYQIPTGTSLGPATILVFKGNNLVNLSGIDIRPVAPGLFTANGASSGVPAALVLRIKGDYSIGYESVSRYDEGSRQYVPTPIDLGAETDQVFLVLFGTGARGLSGIEGVKAIVGESPVPAIHVLPLPDYIGLDQITVGLPRTLTGKGEVQVEVMIDGKRTNPVTIQIQ